MIATAKIMIVAGGVNEGESVLLRKVGPWSHSPEPACVGLCQARQCIPHFQVGGRSCSETRSLAWQALSGLGESHILGLRKDRLRIIPQRTKEIQRYGWRGALAYPDSKVEPAGSEWSRMARAGPIGAIPPNVLPKVLQRASLHFCSQALHYNRTAYPTSKECTSPPRTSEGLPTAFGSIFKARTYNLVTFFYSA